MTMHVHGFVFQTGHIYARQFEEEMLKKFSVLIFTNTKHSWFTISDAHKNPNEGKAFKAENK